MIYSVDFLDVVGNINPIELCKYLRDLSWNEINIKNSKIRIFQKNFSNELLQVKIPLEKSFNDFNETMLQTCKTIALYQNKSLEQTILELLNPLSDILRVRINNKNIKNGSILFEDALDLYENAKKLITSTAMSLYNKSIIYRGKLPDQVQNFIDNCRYGQTEIGSYVVSIVCPFLKETKDGQIQLSLFSEEDDCTHSITRKITKKLIKDLTNVKSTIDSGEDLDKLIKSPTENLNVNFLEALKNLNISEKDSDLEISTKWAPTINIDEDIQGFVSFNNDYYDPIKSKVDYYKSLIESSNIEILGKIKSLSSEPIVEDRNSGVITVVTIIDDRKKVLKIKLNKENYQSAVTAHKLGKYVKISCKPSESNGKLYICENYEEIE